MPRSSRHKSSKHSSREATEYSDSEKDSSLKERKGKEESGGVRASKDSGSSEKRKLDLKDGKESHGGSGNGEYSGDYTSSKRRKERSDGRATDRWNGGEDDYYVSGEGPKKSSKASGDSKSKRRDDGVGLYEELEELKKNNSSGKGEGRHRDRDLSRKEGRESGGVERDKEKERERERKNTDGRSERLGSNDDHRGAPKQVVDNTDLNARVNVGSPDPHIEMEKRTRKRRDGSVDADKYQDDIGDMKGKRLSSRDDSGKDGKLKDEKHKDERYKDKQREDLDRQRDGYPAKDYHPSSRSGDKQFRDEKDAEETLQKRSKFKDNERKVENAHDYDRDRNRDSELRDWDRERDRGHSRGYDYDHDCDRNRDRRRDRQRDHDREHDRDRDRDHDYVREYGGSRHDERTVRYRGTSRGRRGSPDGQDDINDSQSRSIKTGFSDMENKALTGDRNVLEVSKGRSQSRQAYSDKSSNKWRTSPSSNSHVPLDDNRHMNPEDLKYRDSTSEQRPKAVPSREVSVPPGLSEKGNKYRSTEKSNKFDDNLLGELSNERSSKASPLGIVEGSPSPQSIECRYVKRSGARRSLDNEETGQRGSGVFRSTEDRPSWDLQTEKPVDNSSPADSSFYNRSNQGNSSSLVSPRPGFRVGPGSPSFIGLLEDDGRVNSNARYRRSSDPNMGRVHGNAWRGVPNWASPVPNGFIPFQHGPPSGGFQGMMPQFPGTLFGVRPSMEINHSGMPYHMADADRFSSHLRPLGWHNLMDGSGPSHVHGWDGSNGAFRDEPHIYGTAEWDQNRHPFSGRGWESSSEMWKGQNGEAKRDLPSPSHKDDYPVPVSEDLVGQAGQSSTNDDSYNQGIDERFAERRSSVAAPVEESTHKNIHEKTPDHSKSWRNDVSHLSSYYLSKLDISAELVHPEAYNKYMNLLGTQQIATVDDTNMHIILQDGSRAGLKASNSLWISSHFPLREGVFKRAMDLYEKQRMETRCTSFLKEGMLEDPILASNQENMEEHVDRNVEKVDDQGLTKDAEMIDAPISSMDEKDIESVSSPVDEEKLGEFVSTPAEESLHSPKFEASVQNHNQEEPGETEPTSCEKEMEGIWSEQVKSGNVDVEDLVSVNTVSSIATESAIGDNLIGINQTNGDHSMSCDSFADAMRVPLCIPDGSPMACEGMISESNESVILSRIHHSPESTH